MRKAAVIEHDALFVNARGKRITRFGIAHVVLKYAALARATCPSIANIHVTPHTFRHTTALHLIQSGVDMTVVKEWPGHADIKTTSLYIDVNTDMMRKALEACPPPLAPRTTEPETPRWLDPAVLKFLESLSRRTALC